MKRTTKSSVGMGDFPLGTNLGNFFYRGVLFQRVGGPSGSVTQGCLMGSFAICTTLYISNTTTQSTEHGVCGKYEEARLIDLILSTEFQHYGSFHVVRVSAVYVAVAMNNKGINWYITNTTCIYFKDHKCAQTDHIYLSSDRLQNTQPFSSFLEIVHTVPVHHTSGIHQSPAM